jgi:predicted MFS family arabinose efflux permease
VNLPLGIAALAGLALRLPSPEVDKPERPLDVAGAVLLAAATSALMLVCVLGGETYAWDSAPILGLIAATIALGGLLVAQERRAPDPLVPFQLLRTRTVAVASSAMFLATASLFAITVFVPLFLQITTGASPTQAGLLLAPMMLGVVVSTTLSGRAISKTGRYKRYPVLGLGLMTAALVLMAALASSPSQLGTGIALVLFGLGFGMVTQVLMVAVQNSVDQRQLGIATAATSFFRGLGGAVGAAVLGAVFAAQAGLSAGSTAGVSVQGLDDAVVADIAGAIGAVFLVAAPLAAVGLIAVLFLHETPLRTHTGDAPARPPEPRPATPTIERTQHA